MDIIHLIILLSLVTFLTKSTSSKNNKYDICSKKFSCGDLDDLGYPFYDGSTSYDYCGYPGFNLTCIPDSPPQITISGQDSYLKNADEADKYTITVSRNDTWQGKCPDSLTNTTMDISKFNIPSTDQNITFFYECQGSNDVLYGQVVNATSCDRVYGAFHGFYLTQKMVEEHTSLNLFTNCKFIFIPVLESKANAVELVHEPDNLLVLINAFEVGFELGLIVNNTACDSCMGSKGLCGYDFGSNKFQCHCDDQDYDLQCRVSSAATTSQSKGIGKANTNPGVCCLVNC